MKFCEIQVIGNFEDDKTWLAMFLQVAFFFP
jgi:hypothetical protein